MMFASEMAPGGNKTATMNRLLMSAVVFVFQGAWSGLMLLIARLLLESSNQRLSGAKWARADQWLGPDRDHGQRMAWLGDEGIGGFRACKAGQSAFGRAR
jgi:hypothetical protein